MHLCKQNRDGPVVEPVPACERRTTMLPGLTRGREKLAFNAWKRWPLFPCPIPALRRLPVLRNRHGTPPFCILQHVCRRAPAPHVNHRNIRWPGPVPASQKRVPIGRYGAWVCHQYRVPRLRALVRKYGPDPASPIFFSSFPLGTAFTFSGSAGTAGL